MRMLLLGLVVVTMVAVAVLLLSGEVTVRPEDAPERGETARLDEPLPEYVAPPTPQPQPEPEVVPQPEPPAEKPILEGRPRTNLLVRVVYEEKRPVPRATLYASRMERDEWLGEAVGVVDGIASVRRPTDKRSVVDAPLPANADRLTLQVTNPTDADGMPLNLLETTVEVDDLDRDEFVVVLPAGRQLTGRIVDETGKAVEGVQLIAGPPNAYSESKETTTDADGRYRIVALKPGALEARVPLDEVWVPIGRIQLSPDQDTLDLTLERRRDFVVIVLGPDGAPFENAKVMVAWGRYGRGWTEEGTSDAEGRFVAKGVPSKMAFVVRAEPSKDGPPFPKFLDAKVHYGDGTYELHLPPAVAIAGTVVYEDGTSVPMAYVYANRVGPSRSIGGGFAEVHEGSFELQGLAPVRHELTATVPGYGHRTLHPVEVTAPARDVRIVLRKCVTARGKVLDMPGGRIVLDWYSPGYSQQRTVKEDGSFSIDALLDVKGSLYVRAWTEDGSRVCLIENVRPTERTFEVRLEPSLKISGRCGDTAFGASSGPLAMRLFFVRGPVVTYARVGTDGRFVVSNLAPGPWRIELHRGGSTWILADAVQAGTLDLDLEVPAELR